MNNITPITFITLILIVGDLSAQKKDDKKKLVKSELYIFPDKQQVKFVNYYLGGVVETLEDKYRVDGKYIVIDAGKMPPFFVAIEMGNEFMKYKVDESISITYRRIE